MEVAETPEITGGATALFTVTETALLVAVFPAASVAIAVKVCDPFVPVVVSHDSPYEGPAPVTGLPRFAPSTWNCTCVTPTLSEAFADTATVPASDAPLDGAVMETAGAVPPEAGPTTVNSSIRSSETLYPPPVRYSYAPKSKFEEAVQLGVAGV